MSYPNTRVIDIFNISDSWVYDGGEIHSLKLHWCEHCGMSVIDNRYVMIMEKLKEAGLIPQDQKLICCSCGSFKKNIGRLPLLCPNNPTHSIQTEKINSVTYRVYCCVCYDTIEEVSYYINHKLSKSIVERVFP